MINIKDIEKIIILSKKYNIKKLKIKTEKLSIHINNKYNNIINESENKYIYTKENNLITIKSPIVGIFYSSPSPQQEPFIKQGDKIKIGDTICIIEAMKILNEIKSEYTGIIEEILIKNETPVEYNQDLFTIKYV